MQRTLCFLMLAPALLAIAVPVAANADDDGGWSGTGELGLAASRGNSKSENLNAKLNFAKEDDTWKDNFYLTALRNKGEVTVTRIQNGELVSVDSYQTTSNRYEAGASVGYKLSPRRYVVGALRYENDDFAAFQWQATASLGYGYIVIKNPETELSFEVGPGYKRSQPNDIVVTSGDPPMQMTIHPDTTGEAIARGLMSFKHKITANTSVEDSLLVEAGSDNRYIQNDASLVVNMNERLALKVGYQTRYNSDTEPGVENTDQLLTTNLVYNFQ